MKKIKIIKKKNKSIVLVVISVMVIIILFLSFYRLSDKPIVFHDTGTTCGNIIIGSGKFASKNGFVYFCTHDQILEYDIESGKCVTLEPPHVGIQNLMITDEYIAYTANSSLNIIRKDGKKNKEYFNSEQYGLANLFIDDDGAYFMNGIEGSLFQLDLETLDVKELITGVNSYFVEGNTLYVIARDENGQWQLFYRGRNEEDFKTVKLSFQPIAIYVNGQDIYLAQRSSYQIIRYVEGEEISLPCQSMYYQVLGDFLIYMDKNTYKNSCFALKSYNLLTDEETILAENVYDFCVLDERYIGCQLINPVNGEYILIDTQKNETIQMMIGEE